MVKIPVLNTAGVEATEVLALNLFSAVNATIGRPLAIGTIYDNDQTSGTPLIRVLDQIVDEAAGQASIVIALDKPEHRQRERQRGDRQRLGAGGIGLRGLATQTLTFTPGEMVKVVTVDLINDTQQRARRILRPAPVLAGRRDAAGHQRAGLHRAQRRGEPPPCRASACRTRAPTSPAPSSSSWSR